MLQEMNPRTQSYGQPRDSRPKLSEMSSLTVVGFMGDRFGRKVVKHLESLSISITHFEELGQDEANTSAPFLLPKKEWHKEAWLRRLDGHENLFVSELGDQLAPQDWLNLLIGLDRVFIDKRPIAESLGYLGALLAFAKCSIRHLEPGTPVLFLATPHFSRDMAVAIAACTSGHDVFVVRPSHASCRAWISRLNNTQPGDVAALGNGETFGDQLANKHSEALQNSKDLNRHVRRAQEKSVRSKITLTAKRAVRLTKTGGLIPGRSVQPLQWPSNHYWGYLSHWAMARVKWQGTLNRRAMKATLKEVTTTKSPPTNFIYFPLHYQPERTTVPEAGIWRNQLLLARMLSSICEKYEEQMYLVIKEHPRQPNGDPRQTLMRAPDFYQRLSELPHTILVDTFSDSDVLLRSARVVVTPNGTSAWEAVRFGTPSLTMAVTWHSTCSASPAVQSSEDLEPTLNRLLRMTRSDVEQAYNDFAESPSFMFPGVFSEQHLPEGMSEEVLAFNMAEAIASLIHGDAPNSANMTGK